MGSQSTRLSLGEIVAMTDTNRHRGDAQFLDALVHWLNEPPGRGEVVGFERQPEVGRMLWVLKALHTSLAVSGLRHFLETGMIGRHLYDAERWARQLGAMRTAVYLTRAAALGPSGRIPVQDEERFAFLESLEGTNANPFSRIDQEYRDAVLDEVADSVRSFVRDHSSEIEAAFAQLPVIGGSAA